MHHEITITGVAGHHSLGDSITANIIFVYDFGGIRLAHFASEGEVPTQQMYDEIGTVDVLLIQCSTDPTKLSADEIVSICRRLGPRIVVPEHGTTRLTEMALSHFGGKMVANPSGKLVVRRADLDAANTPRLVNMDNY